MSTKSIIVCILLFVLNIVPFIGAAILAAAMNAEKTVLLQVPTYLTPDLASVGPLTATTTDGSPVVTCAPLSVTSYNYIKVCLVWSIVMCVVNALFIILRKSDGSFQVAILGIQMAITCLLIRSFILTSGVSNPLIKVAPNNNQNVFVSVSDTPIQLTDPQGLVFINADGYQDTAGTPVYVYINSSGTTMPDWAIDRPAQAAVAATADTAAQSAVPAHWSKVTIPDTFVKARQVTNESVAFYMQDHLFPYDSRSARICHLPVEDKYIIKPATGIWITLSAIQMIWIVVTAVGVMKSDNAS